MRFFLILAAAAVFLLSAGGRQAPAQPPFEPRPGTCYQVCGPDGCYWVCPGGPTRGPADEFRDEYMARPQGMPFGPSPYEDVRFRFRERFRFSPYAGRPGVYGGYGPYTPGACPGGCPDCPRVRVAPGFYR